MPRVKYAMNYRPKNSFSMSYASRKVIFPGVAIPQCIDDYNHHMGGVDIADQLRSYYDTQLTSFRTWWPILFWALDTMVTNAYFIYRDMPQTTGAGISHKEFRLQCAWGLILAGHKTQQPQKREVSRTNVTQQTLLPVVRRCDCGHLPIHQEKRLVCWLCRWKHRTDAKSESRFLPKTRWACSKCNTPLCQNDERNCFAEFHEL